MSRIRTTWRILTRFRNPVTVLRDSLGYSGDSSLIYSFRDGSKFAFTPNSNAIGLCNEIIFDRAYDRLLYLARKDSVVVDVGAHAGLFSIRAARNFPQAMVYSYEPSSINYRLLLKNIELNGLENRIQTYNAAVSSITGDRRFWLSTDTVSNSLYVQPGQRVPTTVKSVTMEDVLRDNSLPRIDFLKMDCEGAELEILESMDEPTMSKISTITIDTEQGLVGPMEGLLTKRGFALEKKVADRKRNLFYIYGCRRTD